ncbi:CPBP family intramembrane glutamic endopeptidase [Halorussus lipolyticus]|uniref:CPBP family intramembrane glutamic endopeptidase n=1 Tax=Halorussus lipolyticus TaxID=3034024 RepID=UPI0023E8AB3C|nr:type II CAAX endopeptidase family protein [Halorussus sp. DT80]
MPPAPQYESFAAVTMLVLGLLIVLARASEAMFEDPEEAEDATVETDADDGTDEWDASEPRIPATGAARIEQHTDTGEGRIERRILDDENDPWNDESDWDDGPDRDDTPWGENEAEADARRARAQAAPREEAELDFTTGALLANVAFSQGLFGVAIVGAAWIADLPLVALGVSPADPWNLGLPAVAIGVGVGLALYVANELSAKVADAVGVDYSEGLREALAPDSLGGWAILLGVVLPVIAGFEELLFRAALIGAFSAGFGISPWVLAVFSTVAFAIGHGAQGPGGVAVTGLLGFALAAAFVVSGSLLVVVVAHYLVNALEFVVHEGLGIEWA